MSAGEGAGPAQGAAGRAPSASTAPAAPTSTKPGEMSQPVADPLIGVIVAERYRILEGLGRGGMGIVYKVEHTRLGKLLAMKLLTGELARNPDVVRRFKQEALTVSKLSSPNTVQVFDFGVAEGGLTYLVMELVAGEDLGRVLRKTGPLPFERLAKVMIQACTSLAEAHQKGIVHRDIKPENIMLVRGQGGAEVAKVLDFGLAKLREGSDLNDVTSQGAIVGTPYYMAPEQIRADPVDERSDIYGLGALMYRALTGTYPFNGPTPMAVFTKHLTEEPFPPSRRAPDRQIPPGAERIVLRALRKSPDERYQSVEELRAALLEETSALGSSSVEALLDSTTVRGIAKAAEAAGAASAIATRDEVEAYERTLRRKRYGAWVLAGLLVAAPAAVAVKLAGFSPEEFTGAEREPNNTAGEALLVPIGRTATGFLGKRLDPSKSDRDFYAFDIAAPAPGEPAHVKLHVTALPNLPMCSMLYRQGLATALGVYCVGRPGRDLLIPSLRLEAGRYLLAVMQDLDPYGAAAPPFVLENVSDTYALSIEPAEPDPAREVEPNDQVASANMIPKGAAMAGSLGWARDEDVFCAPSAAVGQIRWSVTDVARDAGAVLEVTPVRGAHEEAPVRVHVAGRGPRSDADVMSPFTMSAGPPEPGVLRCLRVRLAFDPWSGDHAARIPKGNLEAYVIKLEDAL